MNRTASILAAGAIIIPGAAYGGHEYGGHGAEAERELSATALRCMGKVGLEPTQGPMIEGCEEVFRDAPALATYVSGREGHEVYTFPVRSQVEQRSNVYLQQAEDLPTTYGWIGGMIGLLGWAGVVKLGDSINGRRQLRLVKPVTQEAPA